jgi:PAS domain S-box-containing protein
LPGYIGSCFDITERRTAIEDLRTSEQRYALATRAGSVGVWDWDLATNEFWIDPALKRALGYEPLQIDNRLDAWFRHVHPDDAGRLLQDAYAHANDATPSFENEHRMVHRDGNIRWFLTRGSAVRLPNGTAVRITGTDTDITQRKNAEIRLEESRHELARVSRISTLTHCAVVAHEASQPLNAILLNAQASLRWLAGPSAPVDDLRDTLRDIAEAAKQANEVVSRHRAMASRHSGTRQSVDLNDIVGEVVALARSRLQKGRIDVETSLELGLPEVLGDRVELQQVLLNLVLNGIEAVEAANPPSRQLWVRTGAQGTLVQVSVRDAGVGLRRVDAGKLFTPFYTTKASGTGIGLSISRFIIEDHGGRLWAEDHGENGATFVFTVPVSPVTDETRPGLGRTVH